MKEKKKHVTQSGKEYEATDVVKEVIWDIFVAIIIFAWVLIMLLIISFVTSGYLHFTIEKMMIAAVVCGVAGLLYRIIRTIRKYR